MVIIKKIVTEYLDFESDLMLRCEWNHFGLAKDQLNVQD